MGRQVGNYFCWDLECWEQPWYKRKDRDLKHRPLGQACTTIIHQVSSAFRKRLEQQEPKLSSDHCHPKPESSFSGAT